MSRHRNDAAFKLLIALLAVGGGMFVYACGAAPEEEAPAPAEEVAAADETVVKAAFLVAAADHDLHEEEVKLIGHIGQCLELSVAHVRAVLDEMMEPHSNTQEAIAS